ncbi:hypothetical protein A2333_01690 [Candidatus Wolfebacteria bacterium RIFOXYB2_FULL_49_7]|uniref:Uncharacterized protein n=1 Tax=Candidatus Wolfebacteria bacterium RIFOXYB1_FULL_54_12 TaxID=1802559 RepID=A0A1F8DVV8_9BACT|nr:MAG: hypothetical protein A2372_00715 [Candidatus Wolfebacteria bacterium RIFOXYB1_FULL_54_12]OGM93044.1 MAG: hypothetical protein A2333_01690 [Candidatus Wolfebacteria bacterium RIFOXYB2_FULL_49_7]
MFLLSCKSIAFNKLNHFLYFVNCYSTNAHFGQKIDFVSNEQTIAEGVVIPAEAGIQVFAVAPLCAKDSGYRPELYPDPPPACRQAGLVDERAGMTAQRAYP